MRSFLFFSRIPVRTGTGWSILKRRTERREEQELLAFRKAQLFHLFSLSRCSKLQTSKAVAT